MMNYMTSLKGEITDVRLENESVLVAEFIRRLAIQQQTFATNMPMMEWQLRNLTAVLHGTLSEWQEQRPIRHVRRILATTENDLPIGNARRC